MPLLAHLHRWFDRHPFAGDHAIWAITWLLVAGELASGQLVSSDPPVAPDTAEIMVSVALIAPLPFGPRAPVAVFAAVTATCVVQLLVTDEVLIADLAPLVALYYVVVHGPDRIKPVAVAVALAGGVVMSARASFPGVLDGFVVGTAVVTAEVLLAALLGDRRLTRRAQLRALEVERDQQAEIGAARERARIARELHDVIAHSVSVMVAQADGGRYAAREDPDVAGRTLTQIAETGRDALAQMRRLLGVLREGEEASDLPGLVRRLRGSGLPVELNVEGRVREVGPELQQCIHRVAQEALTNALRHADSPQRVEVTLRYLDADVELVVRDDGRAVPGGELHGHGLTGMRERVALQAGTLHAGPRNGGGYEVRARLPLPAGELRA